MTPSEQQQRVGTESVMRCMIEETVLNPDSRPAVMQIVYQFPSVALPAASPQC